MNLAGAKLVAERGRAVPVSYRGIGSANGNRTCQLPVHFSSSRSKSLHLRLAGIGAIGKTSLQNAEVAERWQSRRPLSWEWVPDDSLPQQSPDVANAR